MTIPLTTILPLHQAFAEISADRWSGTPDLNKSAFDIRRAEHLVSFISKPLVDENLFFKTELLFAAETGKPVFIFKSSVQDRLPIWIDKLKETHENVIIPSDVVLTHPDDVTTNREIIFDYFKLPICPRLSRPTPRFWSCEDTASWLQESDLTELSTLFVSGVYVHLLANEWKKSPKIMRQWTMAEVTAKCGGEEKANDVMGRLEKALQKLYPELDIQN